MNTPEDYVTTLQDEIASLKQVISYERDVLAMFSDTVRSLLSPRDDIDPRLDYVMIQADRDELEEIDAFLRIQKDHAHETS